jgi:outer membrane protein TolC
MLFAALLVAGCAYDGAPELDRGPDRTALLAIAAEKTLTADDIMSLVRERNPDLVAARAKLNVARAQLGADSALPDPQVSGTIDHPTKNDPTLVDALSLGVVLDTQKLLTTPARAAKASGVFDQASAVFLWTISQTDARSVELAASIAAGDARMQVLAAAQGNVRDLAKRAEKAMRSGDLSIDQAAPLISAAADIDALMSAAQRVAAGKRADLRALALLATESRLAVQMPALPPNVSLDEARAELESIGAVRPDLMALHHGYRAQDAAVEEAILAQFPAVSIGFTGARDTGNIQTLGGALTLNLPLFGNAQRNVAVQEATRDQLKAEYEARLYQAAFDVERLIEEAGLLRQRLEELEKALPELRRAGAAARQAFLRSDIGGLALATYETTWVTREIERVDLSEALWVNWIATQLTVGRPFGAAASDGGTQ